MVVYFAPLEGVTDAIYRRTHRDCFPGVSKYFIPFVSPTPHLSFTSREQRAISPEENAGVPVVPQVLTKDAAAFVWMSRALRDAGYGEVNLNLGCPSGTVTAKGKGSGMLRDLDGLRAFLDAVFAETALPVSIKTRAGWESLEEWSRLMEIFRQYPVYELILHPRTRREFYSGRAHRELLGDALDGLGCPVVYNGDLFTAQDCRALLADYPGAAALMLGRGMVANPALARQAMGGAPVTRAELRDFHDRVYRGYLERWPANAVLGHMHELMSYMVCCFENAQKPRKAIRKSSTPGDYEQAVKWLFDDFALRNVPAFVPPEERE